MNTRSYSQPELVPTVKYAEHPFKPGQYVAVHSRSRRLAGIDYCSPNCLCFVTFKLQGEGPILTEDIGATAWQAFLGQWFREQFTLHTACMMPDHFHLLLAPTGNGKSGSDIVRGIKLAITHKVKQEHNTWLRWQPSFYDHVLGRADNIEDEFASVRFYIAITPFVPDWSLLSKIIPTCCNHLVTMCWDSPDRLLMYGKHAPPNALS